VNYKVELLDDSDDMKKPALAHHQREPISYPSKVGFYLLTFRLAVAYVKRLRPCYEWEGYSGCPEREALFADEYQTAHPKGYAISAADSQGGWLQYCDPSHTGAEVPVWTSDQGYYPRERYVTYDLELALRVARYYAERGQLDPSVQWEE
jgi:hypothetical protein